MDAGFGVGLGPVAWLLPAELFPTELRSTATAITTGVNWLANFVVGQVTGATLKRPTPLPNSSAESSSERTQRRLARHLWVSQAWASGAANASPTHLPP